jgi:lon-related putative ATP-dependent protease
VAATSLTSEQLRICCDPEKFDFQTTHDLEDLEDFIGQPRALAAMDFGIGIRKEGYHVFAFGDAGIGKYTLIRRFLDKQAANEKAPVDVCYVNNFEEQHKPNTLILPAGTGKKLVNRLENLIEDIRNALRVAFDSEDYQNRKQSVDQELQEKQQEAFEKLQHMAEERELTPMRTPAGLVFAPVRDGEPIPPDEVDKLSDEEKNKLEKGADELQLEAQKIFQKIPQWQREIREKQKELNREVTRYAVGPVISELRGQYADSDVVIDYLDSMEKDIVENAQVLFMAEGTRDHSREQPPAHTPMLPNPNRTSETAALRRYKVNLLVDNSKTRGAPVVYEDNPTLQNLLGRVEHQAQMGALVTDFNMIRPGSLHRANGGYLIVDALKILQQPFAWEALKRVLRAGTIKIESPGQMYSLISTVSLEPEPVPLKVKVILMGSPWLYYMIRHHDPDFSELFKVGADFAHKMDRSEDNQRAYSRLIAGMVRKEKLTAFSREAVARVIEQSARMVGDNRKLSVHMQDLRDLLREADYWSGQNGNAAVQADDVQKAIDARIFRSDRLRELMHEQIQREIILIDTTGSAVGQVNGLSVIQLGEFAFGRPSRITARIRLGKGDVVDIEREVAMGGPIHSKGVLILAGFLGARYAVHHPLSLSASLVFEQSYSGVEGDSASSAELYALLSAISKIPINQSLAVTGSVNQRGMVQPIGGVNEKIEGFFDICKDRGLTGEQGVMIPKSNVQHLMLRHDVIKAVERNEFSIHAVETVDQGIEILTGVPAGTADEDGHYPIGSFNDRVLQSIAELAQRRKSFSSDKTEPMKA